MANLVISQAPAQAVVVYDDVNVQPTILYSVGSVSTLGSNQVVAAPGANSRIVISAFVLQAEADGQVTAQIRSAATPLVKVSMAAINDGLAIVLTDKRPIKLVANEALNINLSAAIAVGYSIQYYIEAV